MKFQYNSKYVNNKLVLENSDNNKKIYDLITKFNEKYRGFNFPLDVTRMTLKEQEEKEINNLENFNNLSKIDKLKNIYENKAHTYEELYSILDTIPFDKSSTKTEAFIASYNSFIKAITDLLYYEETKELKDELVNTSDKDKMEEITKNYLENIKESRKGYLNSLGLDNSKNHINDVKQGLKEGEKLWDTLINNVNHHTNSNVFDYDKADKNYINQMADDYKALDTYLKSKNPIVRFFSFGTKNALKGLKDKIKENFNIADEYEFNSFINKKASIDKENEKYTDNEYLKKFDASDFIEELNQISVNVDKHELEVQEKLNEMMYEDEYKTALSFNHDNVLNAKNALDLKNAVLEGLKIADNNRKDKKINKITESIEIPDKFFESKFENKDTIENLENEKEAELYL